MLYQNSKAQQQIAKTTKQYQQYQRSRQSKQSNIVSDEVEKNSLISLLCIISGLLLFLYYSEYHLAFIFYVQFRIVEIHLILSF